MVTDDVDRNKCFYWLEDGFGFGLIKLHPRPGIDLIINSINHDTVIRMIEGGYVLTSHTYNLVCKFCCSNETLP